MAIDWKNRRELGRRSPPSSPVAPTLNLNTSVGLQIQLVHSFTADDRRCTKLLRQLRTGEAHFTAGPGRGKSIPVGFQNLNHRDSSSTAAFQRVVTCGKCIICRRRISGRGITASGKFTAIITAEIRLPKIAAESTRIFFESLKAWPIYSTSTAGCRNLKI